MKAITHSRIDPLAIYYQGEDAQGNWVEAFVPCLGSFTGGVIVSFRAPAGESEDTTFTAENGRRYMDTADGCRFHPAGRNL